MTTWLSAEDDIQKLTDKMIGQGFDKAIEAKSKELHITERNQQVRDSNLMQVRGFSKCLGPVYVSGSLEM